MSQMRFNIGQKVIVADQPKRPWHEATWEKCRGAHGSIVSYKVGTECWLVELTPERTEQRTIAPGDRYWLTEDEFTSVAHDDLCPPFSYINPVPGMQDVRIGSARITYDPAWSPSQPWKTYVGGTACGIYSDFHSACRSVGYVGPRDSNAADNDPAPKIAAGMRRVTHDEFYVAIGPKDVTPSPRGPWSDRLGYTNEWRYGQGAGRLAGVSDGGTHLCLRRYWLPEVAP